MTNAPQMHPRPRKLPISIQTFSQIISGGYYYVDKTHLALQLTQEDKYYFFSRPRRFGKSLFLDTLKELFEGNEALFKGLHIHDKWDWAQSCTVLRISFAGRVLKNLEDLAQVLDKQLQFHESRLGLPARFPDSASRFSDLIQRAHQQTGQSGPTVVVLVDEYDKPTLDNIEDAPTAKMMLEGLKDFYSVLKDCDEQIRLAFVTGVSKFSKAGLFSGLNNLRDLTVVPGYSALCGYTDHDVDTVFAPELRGLDRENIRRWYNGYNWRGTAVYNPYDLLLLFREREFDAYWFESATPTFLLKTLTERRAWLPALGRLEATSALLSAFDVDKVTIEALMFQSGYLTIDRVEVLGEKKYYRLKFPNEEVRQSLHGSLLQAWCGSPGAESEFTGALHRLVAAGDIAALEGLVRAFFASIPYQWHVKNPIAEYEGYYASVFYALFVAAGADVRVEDATSMGRIDMAVTLGGHILVIEFKVVELEPNGKALAQIKERAYADKYRAAGLPIHLVGVEFSSVQRNVVGFEVEPVRLPQCGA